MNTPPDIRGFRPRFISCRDSYTVKIRSCCYSIVLMVLTTGCGDSVSPLADLVKVTGTISCKGEPLESGTVSFVPANPAIGKQATASVTNGLFEMATTASSPGVVAGKYRVSVSFADATGVPSDPSNPRPVVKSPVPAKYSNPATSGLEVDVQPGLAPLDWNLEE